MPSQDLEKRLADLCSMHDHPALFISEYFYDIRNSIDYDTERLLQKEQDKSKEEQVNSLRNELLKILNKIEHGLLSQLKTSVERKRSVEVYASVKQRIEQLTTRKDVDINKYEECALEIYDQMNGLEKKLFKNQTVAYISSIKQEYLGCLIYICQIVA